MSRDGSGNYVLPAVANPPLSGATISSTGWAIPTLNDIASALTQSLSKDGQTTATGNIPMGGNRFLNVGNATQRNEVANWGQLQDGAALWLSSIGGTGNAITANVSPTLPAYVDGQTFQFACTTTNTGAATIAIDGLAAVAITKGGSTALAAGDLTAGSVITLTYTGTGFQLVSPYAVSTVAGGFTVSSGGLSVSGNYGGVAAVIASTDSQTASSPWAFYARTTSAVAGDCWIAIDAFGAWGARLGVLRATVGTLQLQTSAGGALGVNAGASTFAGGLTVSSGGVAVVGTSNFASTVTAPTVAVTDNSTNIATTAVLEGKTFGNTARAHSRGSPSLSTAYTPSATKPSFVQVQMVVNNGNAYWIATTSLGNVWIGSQTGATANNLSVGSFMLAPGESYTLTISAGVLGGTIACLEFY